MKRAARKKRLVRRGGKEKARKRALAAKRRPRPAGGQERLVRNATEIWTPEAFADAAEAWR